MSDLVCYAVADERDNGPGDRNNQGDTLTILDPNTGNTSEIGLTGTTGIEAISFGPNSEIYAANGGRLGTLNKNTGVFTPRPQDFGIAGGSVGEIDLEDVDGIAFDLAQDILFGAQRLPQPPNPPGGPPPDLLFAINPTTGAHIPDYFGAGIDYVVVPQVQDDEGNVMNDLDDIQFDPVSGDLYGVLNNGGASGVLVTIDVATGIPTPIGTFRDTQNDVIDDIEGISFDNSGNLFVSTGDNFTGDFDDLNSLYRVDPMTALGELVGPFPIGPKDYEGLACLSAEAAIVLRKYTNGPGQTPQDADDPTGPAINVGDTVTWTYIFTNTGVLDLTNFVLEDDQLGLIDTSLQCVPPDDTLAPGFSLTCTVTGIAAAGQYRNDATVTATSVPTPIFPEFIVSDTNPSHYFGTVVLPPDEPATLGDRVWRDLNANGVQDDGEPGLPGVTVTLFSCSNAQVGDPVVTDENGEYLFTDLPPGCYYVIFTRPDGFTFTTPNSGDDASDSDANPADGKSATVALAEGETNLTVDAGLVAVPPDLAVLGDRVWHDADGDGVQDAGEAGLGGVTVTLLTGDCSTPTGRSTVTGDGGLYLFDNLTPGSYCVQFALPNGFTFTTPNVGDDASDSDANPADGTSGSVTLAAGEANLTVDAGLVAESSEPLATLGDVVWFDENLNGLQDGVGTEGGEQGVPNVQVTLISVDSVASASSLASPAAVALTATLTTDENGRYLFTGLPAGDYYVQFNGPAEYGFTTPDAEGNTRDAEDSDGQVPRITLSLSDNVDEVEPGQTVVYTIAYSNTHPTLVANNAVLSTTVPAGTTFVAAGSSVGWDCAAATAGSVCTFDLVTVDPGTSGSVDFVVRLQDTDDEEIPAAVFILVRLIQSRQANTQIVTLLAGEENLTLDAGLVPIQNSGDLEADEQTPTTTVPTGLPPTEQPQQQESLFLPSLQQTE